MNKHLKKKKKYIVITTIIKQFHRTYFNSIIAVSQQAASIFLAHFIRLQNAQKEQTC